ncbi:MAG: spheroidene monooxygenase [Ferruginibacter sp.]
MSFYEGLKTGFQLFTIMQVFLTIIRYRKIYIPFAIFAMAIHRLPLLFNRNISFFKLMGSGKNGTFDKTPDLQQWAILSVQSSKLNVESFDNNVASFHKNLYGSFITKWFSFFGCETFTLLLQPIEGHGTWDGKKVFGELPPKTEYEGMIAILTRATIRVNKLKYFWQNVAAVANRMAGSKGFITSFGIGEIPWIKQATFSIWQSKEDMKAFAYGMKAHADVIQKTRQQQWYSEDMFTRFKITGSIGTIKGEKINLG